MGLEPDEWRIQRAFTIYYKGERWAKGPKKGQWKVEPAELPGVVSWHTPNGGKREAFEALRFKQIGVEAGLHDYFFLWGGLYGLEFKEPGGGKLLPSQLRMHSLLLAAGLVASAVVDNLEDAKSFVRKHGLVIPGR
jgi:hypothetical protein